MTKNRLEAFSDGVIAVLITILVLELRAPHGASLGHLSTLVPLYLCYVLSFVMVGIYWNNHHHMFHAVREVDGRTLWANMHLLFWLSLIPFTTAWMGENHFAPAPTAVYGAVLLLAGFAYTLLARSLVRLHGKDSALAKAIGRDRKGKVSVAVYAAAVPLAFVHPAIAHALYVAVALLWFVPDRRIEDTVVRS